MILADEQATYDAGASLAAALRPGDVVLLRGSLGAGKTTFVRGLLAGLGHEGEVPSPSFAIVQPYDALDLPLWHADLYRVEDAAELDELGLETILSDGALVVEWPEHAGAGAWPETSLDLSLEVVDGDARRLTARQSRGWEGRWLPR